MKNEIFHKAISWAEKRGLKRIKANIIDFDTPTALIDVDKDKAVIPDITGIKGDRKFYIEIARKAENKQALISKWKLFATLAERKGGKLYLLAARGHKAFTEGIVKKYNLKNTMVVSI